MSSRRFTFFDADAGPPPAQQPASASAAAVAGPQPIFSTGAGSGGLRRSSAGAKPRFGFSSAAPPPMPMSSSSGGAAAAGDVNDFGELPAAAPAAPFVARSTGSSLVRSSSADKSRARGSELQPDQQNLGNAFGGRSGKPLNQPQPSAPGAAERLLMPPPTSRPSRSRSGSHAAGKLAAGGGAPIPLALQAHRVQSPAPAVLPTEARDELLQQKLQRFLATKDRIQHLQKNASAYASSIKKKTDQLRKIEEVLPNRFERTSRVKVRLSDIRDEMYRLIEAANMQAPHTPDPEWDAIQATSKQLQEAIPLPDGPDDELSIAAGATEGASHSAGTRSPVSSVSGLSGGAGLVGTASAVSLSDQSSVPPYDLSSVMATSMAERELLQSGVVQEHPTELQPPLAAPLPPAST